MIWIFLSMSSQLAMKNESKESSPFWTFFHPNETLWSAAAPVYCIAKIFFATSNANILQSTRWKFLKFFPHLLKTTYYKILRLHVSKFIYFLKIGTCIRFSINFLQKNNKWRFIHMSFAQLNFEENIIHYRQSN